MPRGEPCSSPDKVIGMRIRERRMMLGLTQRQFAELLGVSNQQFHKYEHGINSLSAGRLYELACQSNTPVEYFFEGLERDELKVPPRQHRLLDVMRSLGEMQHEKQLEAI